MFLITTYFCMIYLISTDENTDIIQRLKEFVIKNENAHPILLTELFLELQEKYNLFGTSFNNENDMAECVVKSDPSIDKNDVTMLYKYYNEHTLFLQQIEARNKLVYFAANNPKSSCLDRSTLLENFFLTHKISKKYNSFTDFKDFMMEIDHRIDLEVLKILYPHVHEYQEFQEREPLRKTLMGLTSPPTTNTDELQSSLEGFVIGYQMKGRDISQLRTFRKLFYDVDFTASDDVSNILHPHVHKYASQQNIKNIRQKLLQKITENPGIKVYGVKNEVWLLVKAYDLVNKNITNFEYFKKEISGKDDPTPSEDLNLIHKYVYEYMKYSYKINARNTFFDFLKRHSEPTILEISNYIEPIIAAYNLYDHSIESACQLNTIMHEQDGITAKPESNILYKIYVEYKTKIDLNLVKDRALSIINKKPNEKINFYSESLKEMTDKYRLNNFGVSRLKYFVQYLKEMNPFISETEAETLHKYILRFIEYEKILSAYDELSNYILKNENSKSKTTKPSEKIIKCMKILQPYLSDYDKFKNLIRNILLNHDRIILKQILNMGFQILNLVYVYENSKNDFGEVRKLQPGDIDFDGSIVPPNSNNQLSWYKFYQFFGAVPVIVRQASSLAELTVTQRWWNSEYKKNTGIDYYVFDPLVSKGLSIDAAIPAKPVIAIPARASH